MHRREFLKQTSGLLLAATQTPSKTSRTEVSIQADQFFINGRPTYQGRSFRGMKVEGLLMSSRMVQGVFDDLNPQTRDRWKYPDTGKWDADRNTREFMPVLFNEDDHFDFEKPVNNMLKALEGYASWGYFDPGKGDYSDGYQCPPVNWGVNSDRKRAFFRLLKEATGA